MNTRQQSGSLRPNSWDSEETALSPTNRATQVDNMPNKCQFTKSSNCPEPLVSIIIASHNYGRFLGDAIRSVQAQTEARWECIIIDDASTDGTEQIAQSFVSQDHRIRYVLNESNLGAAETRNVGLRLAIGRYIAILDADDRWHRDKLRIQLEALEQSASGVICFTSKLAVFADREKITRCPKSWLSDLTWGLRAENLILHSSVVMCRNAAMDLGGYDPSLPPAEDWDLWLRFLERFGPEGFVYVDQILTYYRVHGSNISSNAARMGRAERRILAKFMFGSERWAFRRPLASIQVLEEYLFRRVSGWEVAGRNDRAFWNSCCLVALAPVRRHRWRRCWRLLLAWVIGRARPRCRRESPIRNPQEEAGAM